MKYKPTYILNIRKDMRSAVEKERQTLEIFF